MTKTEDMEYEDKLDAFISANNIEEYSLIYKQYGEKIIMVKFRCTDDFRKEVKEILINQKVNNENQKQQEHQT